MPRKRAGKVGMGVSSETTTADCRCLCGSLLARVVAGGVELKCRRCKRTILFPWTTRPGWLGPPEDGRPIARPDPPG